ncbi:MAG: WYL domain-containing protein, partial [Acidimicrobiia bacterium]|nr:WYL domain-containing protein [Acidimicrobiia bacterium]
MSRTTAGDRLRRVLAVVPWIVANPGHRVADVAARFGLREADLLSDLEVVYMVGLPPYSPDALIDVQIDDEGRVSILLADYFSRPLRLTPGQGLALLASSEALLSVPGTDPDGALARALDKLAQVVGVDGADAVDIRLGSAEHDTLDQLRLAAAEATEVEILYYSYNRDARTERAVAPWRVFAESGNWYVHAWCHTAEGERIFRVDRIESLTPLYRPARMPADGERERIGVFQPREGTPRVTLRLEPDAAWVVDNYPSEKVEQQADGRLTVELAITEVPWLERLLVSLGPQAE